MLLSWAYLEYPLGGDPAAIEGRFREAYDCCVAADPGGREVNGALCGLATVLRHQGRFDDADRASRAALEQARAFGLPALDQATPLNDLGESASQRGDYAAARQLFHQALALLTPSTDMRPLASAIRNNLGLLEMAVGRFSQALQEFQASLELMEGCPPDFTFDPDEHRALTLGNIGTTYNTLGDTAQALRHLDEACAILTRIRPDTVQTAMALQQLSATLLQADDPRAEQRMRESVAIARRAAPRSLTTAHVLTGLADQLYGEREGEARDLLKEASVILEEVAPRSRAMGNVLAGLIGLHMFNGETSLADSLTIRLLNIARGLEDSELTLRSLELLALSAEEAGDAQTAIRHLDEAIAIAERMRVYAPPGQARSQAVGALKPMAYDVLIAVLLDNWRPGNDERSFDVMESFRARSLLDLLDERDRGDPGRPPDDESAVAALLAQVNHEIAATPDPADLETLERRRLELQERAETLARRRYLALPEYDQASFAPRDVLDDLRGLLAEDTLYIAYEVTVRATYRWLVRKCRIWSGFVSLSSDELPDLVTSAVGSRDDGARVRLAQLLDLPEASVAGVTRLIVSSSGALHRLPFEILPLQAGGIAADRWTISYVPSAAVMLAILRRGTSLAKPGTFIGYGADSERYGTVPFVDEVKSIAELFGDGGRFFLGPQATKRRVTETVAGHRYVHFATHGLVDDARPAYSGLVLSPPEPGDGPVYGIPDTLQTYELFRLPLVATELVTCSACESGVGVVRTGDGLVGMAEALFSAGARWVVVSLWEVSDVATKDLMMIFYQGLEAGLDVPDALAAAKAEVRGWLDLEKWGEEPFWAAFVALGATPRR
ncbi:CHAT domain-containing protein [Streptosporangiaceae bacterium NEAU-GS5]|nr:CHAT domain-containing protein [Streptosporangiaceae bacterium NEAU-GS5]